MEDTLLSFTKLDMEVKFLIPFLQVNIIVTLFTGSFVLYTQSAAAAYFSAGAVLCSLSVKVVKRIIRQPRPLHPSSRKKSYG